jgi:hypothetical protein
LGAREYCYSSVISIKLLANNEIAEQAGDRCRTVEVKDHYIYIPIPAVVDWSSSFAALEQELPTLTCTKRLEYLFFVSNRRGDDITYVVFRM